MSSLESEVMRLSLGDPVGVESLFSTAESTGVRRSRMRMSLDIKFHLGREKLAIVAACAAALSDSETEHAFNLVPASEMRKVGTDSLVPNTQETSR